jgi:hypothetical protein
MNLKKLIYRIGISIFSKSFVNIPVMIKMTKKIFSNVYEVGDLGNINVSSVIVEKEESQMEKVRRKNIIRVAIVENKAYFVHDNIFYTAGIINGEVDRSSASPINTIDMSKKEINNLLSILDNLNS